MRIVGGEFGGRQVAAPKGMEVRPTQDRVRAALFNMLQHDVAGVRFLDLFAGTGAVGLEALSRGAASATFVESDRRHADCIRANVASLGLDPSRATVVQADVFAWLSAAAAVFGVVFADPPYDLCAERGFGGILEALSARNMVAPGGLFVSEMRANQTAGEIAGWDLCRNRVYGQTRLAVYRRLA